MRQRRAALAHQPRGQRQRLRLGIGDRFASSAWLPAKIWKPRHSAPLAIIRRASAGTRSASTPKGLAPPPIFMPDPLRSKSGLTRIARRGLSPSARADGKRAVRLGLGFEVERHACA
jgi:hypothetical protein